MISLSENSQNISYAIESEGEKYCHLYEMRVHIGKEIAKIQRQRGLSNDQIAETIGTSVRNWSHLKTRDDMALSMLWRVSEVLDYNFFELINPIIKEMEDMEEPEAPMLDKNVPKYTVNFQIKYPEPLIEQLGKFMGQVKSLAHKYGFELV